MKKIKCNVLNKIPATILLLMLSSALQAQVYAGATRIDSLPANSVLTATVVFHINNQSIQNYSVNVTETGFKLLRAKDGTELYIRSLPYLLTLIIQNGFELKHMTSVAYDDRLTRSVNPLDPPYLLHTMIFQRRGN